MSVAHRADGPSTFAALRYKPFRRVLAASFVSQTGDWFQITGRSLLVYRITGSVSALGIVYLATFLPVLLFTNFGGVIADRFDRRRVLIACQFFATAGAVIMGLLALTETATLLNVAVLSFFLGTVMSVMAPAQSALIPAIVPPEYLTSAVAIHSASGSASRIVGPLLAGLLLPIVGISWLFFINAFSFVFVIAAWVLTRVAPQPPVEKTGTFRAVKVGISYARRAPAIGIPIAATAVLGGFGLIYQPLSAAWATEVLAHGADKAGARAYGLTQAAIGAGAVIGALMLARIRIRPGRLLSAVFAGFAVSLTALALATEVWSAILLCVVMGLFQFATSTHAMSILQHHAPEELRGRLLSLWTMAFIGLYPITGVIAGELANEVGLRPILAFSGVVCVAFSIPLIRWARVIDEPFDEPALNESPENVAARAYAVELAEEVVSASEAPSPMSVRQVNESIGPHEPR